MTRAALPALTGLRFYAALAVALSHFTHLGLTMFSNAAVAPLDGGRPAVALFFVLSGFILTYNYGGRLNTAGDRGAYFRSRFARIYPVHLLGLALAAIPIVVLLGRGDHARLLDWYSIQGHPLPTLAASLVAQLLVLTAWFPVAAINQPWNGPAWSISCEVFFYAMLPFLLKWMPRLPNRGLLAFVIGAWLLQGAWIIAIREFIPANRSGFLVSQFPITHLFEFVLGIAVALWFTRGGQAWLQASGRATWWLVGSLVGILLLAVFVHVSPMYYVLTPLFAVLIASLGAQPNRYAAFSSPALVLLGEASFSLYLIHVPLARSLQLLGVGPALGTLCVVLVIGLSIAVHLRVEEPARLALRSYGRQRRAQI